MFSDAKVQPKRPRILIVEDEPFIALTLEAMMSELGFEVAGCAAKISTALEVIQRGQVDGAILDVNLGAHRIDPVADLLASLECPFFFTTGHSISGVPTRHAGRIVLQKPFGIEQLASAMCSEFCASTGEGQVRYEADAGVSAGDQQTKTCCATEGPTPTP
ncbi:response regulator [Beijerinckiaceae bacterium]|nr:response regulator [Beijerinckiaceae bacterium]